MLRHVTAPDGVQIACELSGRGPALVLVHGAGSARWGFALLRPQLEDKFTVVAIDRRGRGDSGDGEGEYALEREWEDVAAVVRAAPGLASRPEGEPALLFGHSYGGLVSAAAACRLDGLPRLALYEPPMGGALPGSERVNRWESLIHAGERDTVVREFLAEVGGYTEADIDELAVTPAWELRKQVVHTMPRELHAERRFEHDREGLAALTIPVLMLVGSDSPEWAKRSTDAYADAFRDVTVTTLDGQGHGASAAAPQLVAHELAGFLSR